MTRDWRLRIADVVAADDRTTAGQLLRDRSIQDLAALADPLLEPASCGSLSHVGYRILRVVGAELERREWALEAPAYWPWLWIGASA